MHLGIQGCFTGAFIQVIHITQQDLRLLVFNSKGSSSFNFFSPVWWFTVHPNRNETSWPAWASGTIFNALWYAGGKWKWVARILGRVLTILEIYLFYISATAAYASSRGNCVAIQVSGAKWPWSNGIRFVVPPYLWSERCRG
ncbi:hypothetical protein [Embleya sp. NPDC005575]|uniref:hypothetical protein n=1 Tax=Embleya sp. NPDC005575 TaxID=3156892 RepID=UPI0033A44C6F